MQTILITGARAPIALELARSFYNNKYRVILADTLRFPLTRFSNSIDVYYQIPSPRFFPEDFIRKVQDIIVNEKITHIIPTCEEAFYFSRYKKEFHCKVWTSDFTLMEKLHNKLTFSEQFRHLVSIPDTQLVNTFTDWENSYQYVFKPVFSRFASFVIKEKKLASDYFKNNKKDWIAQQLIKGIEICIYSIWDNGKMKAYAAYHPAHRIGKGAGIFFAPYEHNGVFEQVKSVGEAIGYTGQLSFDVIIDNQGKPYFIECNPRATSGGHLINTHLSNAFLTNEPIIHKQDGKSYCVATALFFNNPFTYFSHQIKNATDVVFSKKDVMPLFLQGLSLVELARIKYSKKISWLNASTYDIEWNGDPDPLVK